MGIEETKPGDVICYAYSPYGDWLSILVIAKKGQTLTYYDPFLDRDVDAEWRANAFYGLVDEKTISDPDKGLIQARAKIQGLELRFKTVQ